MCKSKIEKFNIFILIYIIEDKMYNNMFSDMVFKDVWMYMFIILCLYK